MHHINVVKYFIIITWLAYQNKNELPGTSMAYHDDSFQA